MLLIEGPDLVGKTTLANKLVKLLNDRGWPHVYRHLSRLPECWRFDPVGNYKRLMSPYIVQDRFHFSEPLYASMRGDGGFGFGPGNYRHVQREFENYGGFTIVITADESLIRQRFEAKREMYNLTQVLKVNDMYMTAARDGMYMGINMPCDIWFHCTAGQPFVELDAFQAHLYTNRLYDRFNYPGARRSA